MSLEVVREFVHLRAIARSQEPLREKVEQLQRAVKARLDSHEAQIDELFEAVESLIEPNDAESKKRIGFVPESP